MFTAHGIRAVVGTEHHVGVLTGLGGGFASFDIWVDEDDHEEAAVLLRSLRSHGATPGDRERCDGDASDDDGVHAHDGGAPDAGDAHACAVQDGEDEIPGELRQRIDRRRQTAVALLLGACVTFGTAHAFTRAWMRGALLMMIEAIGIGYVILGNSLGMAAVIGAVITDVAGALWRIHVTGFGAAGGANEDEVVRAPLPVARLRVR